MERYSFWESLHACKQKLWLRAEKYGRPHRRVMRVLVRSDLRTDQRSTGPCRGSTLKVFSTRNKVLLSLPSTRKPNPRHGAVVPSKSEVAGNSESHLPILPAEAKSPFEPLSKSVWNCFRRTTNDRISYHIRGWASREYYRTAFRSYHKAFGGTEKTETESLGPSTSESDSTDEAA
jgi:hypothetical protein